MPEATFQTYFKRYLSVSRFYHSLSFNALTPILRCNYCAHTHTFAELSAAAICEFIKAFGRLLGVHTVWLNCYCFPACHLCGTHHQWPHAWRLDHRPGLQLWLLCRGEKNIPGISLCHFLLIIYHIVSALYFSVFLREQSKLSNSWMKSNEHLEGVIKGVSAALLVWKSCKTDRGKERKLCVRGSQLSLLFLAALIC